MRIHCDPTLHRVGSSCVPLLSTPLIVHRLFTTRSSSFQCVAGRGLAVSFHPSHRISPIYDAFRFFTVRCMTVLSSAIRHRPRPDRYATGSSLQSEASPARTASHSYIFLHCCIQVYLYKCFYLETLCRKILQA